MSLRAVGSESRLPSQTTAAMNTTFFKSEDLQNIPFTIHQSIKFVQKQEGLTIANLRKNSLDRKKGLAKRNSLFAKTEEGISPDKLFDLIEESIEIVENSNNRFVYQTFQVHIWHEELGALWRNLRTIRNTVSTSYLMKPDKFNIKAAYYSLFPGNETINQIRCMLATYTVADFFPIDLPRECLPDPDKSRNEHIYFTTASGSVARLCVFSSSGQCAQCHDLRRDGLRKIVFNE